MSIGRRIKRAVRGEVSPKTIVLESLLRARQARKTSLERARLDRTNSEWPALLIAKNAGELLEHFRSRTAPHFFPGFSGNSTAKLQRELFPAETTELLANAQKIVDEHSWQLLGFGIENFGKEIEWRRDPLSQHEWPLDYHRDIQLIRNDGSDARVLWELNRLGHFVTLARAYVVSGNEQLSDECFSQLNSWARQNPYGRGVNWSCAMEVALRAMNLLVAFEVFRRSPRFDSKVLSLFLRLFYQHGTYITDNLEFSYISTSNHYFSDLAGLLWLGILLPEFHDSTKWRSFALEQLLAEMDKQVLPDGSDFESSTGYHRYILELCLYSFILCKQNQIAIADGYWNKLRLMFRYLQGYLRTDGLAPLIGDSDSGQVIPLRKRRADQHSYLLPLGVVLFGEAQLKTPGLSVSPELLWTLGESAVKQFQQLEETPLTSVAFPEAGTYVMRDEDFYLCMNTSDAGLNGRGSHGHNDALSIEVSVAGRAFIVDPGTYVYSADLHERSRFRSTAFHSTVMIDQQEQNTTLESMPFVIGNEAKPAVLNWETSSERDRVVAEHYGYKRLPSPVVHRRSIVFDKRERHWLIEDEFIGEGEHTFEARFHFAPDLALKVVEQSVVACHENVGIEVRSLDLTDSPELEAQATSRDYGQKRDSFTACWRISSRTARLRWLIQLRDSDVKS